MIRYYYMIINAINYLSTVLCPSIKSLACLASQLSLVDHRSQESRRLEPRPEGGGQIFGDGKADIEADQIGQPQRTHRMVIAELHGPIDVFGRSHSILQHKD